MATINIGGLATGLDTNAIVSQLVALERRRAVDLLRVQQLDAESRRSALGTFQGKVAALLAAVDALRDPQSALGRKATSSDDSIVRATAGSGALPGTTEITVVTLARGSIATSASGKAGADATVAAGSGTFSFRLGSGDVQSVAVDATTTLSGLAAEINALGAGVTATVVNVGTAAAPDYRLRLASRATGSSNDLAIVTDDTDLGVAVTQSASDARFTVSGFATELTRESNVVNDVVPGVTLTLAAVGGPVAIAVETDVDQVAADVEAVVTAFNDLAGYVAQQSQVTQDTGSADRDVSAGPLAFDAAPSATSCRGSARASPARSPGSPAATRCSPRSVSPRRATARSRSTARSSRVRSPRTRTASSSSSPASARRAECTTGCTTT